MTITTFNIYISFSSVSSGFEYISPSRRTDPLDWPETASNARTKPEVVAQTIIFPAWTGLLRIGAPVSNVHLIEPSSLLRQRSLPSYEPNTIWDGEML